MTTTPSCYNHQGKYPTDLNKFDPSKILSLKASGNADPLVSDYSAAFPVEIKDPTTGVVAKYAKNKFEDMNICNLTEMTTSWAYDDNITDPVSATKLTALHTFLTMFKSTPSTTEIDISAWRIALLGMTQFDKGAAYEKNITQAMFTDLLDTNFTAIPDAKTRLYEIIEQWILKKPVDGYEVISSVLKSQLAAFDLTDVTGQDQDRYRMAQKLLETALRASIAIKPGIEPVIAYDTTGAVVAVKDQFNKMLATSVVNLSYDGTFEWHVTKPLERFKGVAMPVNTPGWRTYFDSTAYKNYYVTSTKHAERIAAAKSTGGLTDEEIINLIITAPANLPRVPMNADATWLDSVLTPHAFMKAEDGIIEFAFRELMQLKAKDLFAYMKGLNAVKFTAKMACAFDHFITKFNKLNDPVTGANKLFQDAVAILNAAKTAHASAPTATTQKNLDDALYAIEPLAKKFIEAKNEVRSSFWQTLMNASNSGEIKVDENFPVDQVIGLFTALGPVDISTQMALDGTTPLVALADHTAVLARFANPITPSNSDLTAIIALLGKYLPKQVASAINLLPTAGIDTTALADLKTANDDQIKVVDIAVYPPLAIVTDFMNQGISEKEAYARAIDAYTYNPLNPLEITSEQKDKALEIMQSIFASSTLTIDMKRELYFGPTTTDALIKQRALSNRLTAQDLVKLNVVPGFAAIISNPILAVVTNDFNSATVNSTQTIAMLETIPDAFWGGWKQIIVSNNGTRKLSIITGSTLEKIASILGMTDIEVGLAVPNSVKAKRRTKEIFNESLALFPKECATFVHGAIRALTNAKLAEVSSGLDTREQILQRLMNSAVEAYVKTTGLSGLACKQWFDSLIPASMSAVMATTSTAEGFVKAKKMLGIALKNALVLNPGIFTPTDRAALATSITNSGVTPLEATQIETDLTNPTNVQDMYMRNTFVPKFDNAS